jgi:thiamine-phosphate diphosphorylase
MGSQYIIGSTVHNASEASEAIAMGADYIGVGAMFDSPTKPCVEIGGTKLLKEVVGYNHLAIGGITTENVNELYNIGCKGIAVSSALAKSQRPGETAETLLHREAQLA